MHIGITIASCILLVQMAVIEALGLLGVETVADIALLTEVGRTKMYIIWFNLSIEDLSTNKYRVLDY